VRVYVPQSPTPAATLDRDELIAELRARIEDLRTDRDAWRDQARRSDYMASAALERTRELESRLRELEAPQERPEASETVEHAPEVPEPHSAAEEAQDELGAERARRETAEAMLHDGMAEERRRREAAERERDDLRRELFARREPREPPQTAEAQQGRGMLQSAAGGAQGVARRPWWRRVFGR
jgi:chromosome segregation ATPase